MSRERVKRVAAIAVTLVMVQTGLWVEFLLAGGFAQPEGWGRGVLTLALLVLCVRVALWALLRLFGGDA